MDLDTGAVVAAELHPADEGDTTTLSKTLAKAEANLEAVDAAPTSENPAECVADKGYHSRAVLRALNDSPWKTRIAAPKQTGFSRWHGDEAARRAVTNNRARLKSGVAREAFKLRAEIVERCFAHNLDRGGMRRTWLRGRGNVHKRYLLHVAGHNLSLLMRQLIGAGTPREAVAGGYGGIFVLLTPTGAMLVARGVSQSGQTAFAAAFLIRRRIPHLGVRAGKNHLINGLLSAAALTWERHDMGRRIPHPALVNPHRWGVVRRFILKRDGYRCRACGKAGRLEVSTAAIGGPSLRPSPPIPKVLGGLRPGPHLG